MEDPALKFALYVENFTLHTGQTCSAFITLNYDDENVTEVVTSLTPVWMDEAQVNLLHYFMSGYLKEKQASDMYLWILSPKKQVE